MTNINRSCLLKVTNNALIIANTGQPFSRRGIVSICASHLGTKYNDLSTRSDAEEIDGDLINSIRKIPDTNLISAIQNLKIQTYKTDPNLIPEHSRGEKEISLDYSERFIWELLQNADDAMAPSGAPTSVLIGAKGLGFKSVMEITNEPEIYSGPFHLHFSSDKTIDLLKKHDLLISQQYPIFRIPFEKEPDDEIKELLKKYTTILRLPFGNSKKEQAYQSILELNPRVLLFCQYMEELQIINYKDSKRTWDVKRDNSGLLSDGQVTIMINNEDESGFKITRFQRWAKTWGDIEGESKRHSVSICLPLDENGKPIPTKDQLPLHVFFPTKEEMPFYCIIHASFNVASNRKYIRKGDSDDSILKELSLLLKRIINDGVPALTILKAFVPSTKRMPDEKSWGGRIWGEFKDILKNDKFIPVIGEHLASPMKSHFWEFNIGNVISQTANEVKIENLLIPEIQDDSHCRDALNNLGTTFLPYDEYQKLILQCDNDTLEECKRALHSLYQIVVTCSKPLCGDKLEAFFDQCRKAICWWNHESKARSLKGDVALFKKHPKQITPEWLPIDYLSEDFLFSLDSILQSENTKNERWNSFVNNYLHDATNDVILYHSFIPEIEKHTDLTWWTNNGKDVLDLYKMLIPQVQRNDVIWEDENRIRLGYALRLPTDKGWMSAIKCYAGASWQGPKEFDAYFQGISDRGVLCTQDSWPISINKDNMKLWEKILQYAGVSWGMKLIRWQEIENKCPITRTNIRWLAECPFGQAVNNEHWNQYWAYLEPPKYNKRTEFDWNAIVHEQWAIEYFPDALPKKAIDRLEVLRPIAISISDLHMKYYYDMQGGYLNSDGKIKQKNGSVDSFAYWQLYNCSWIPCKQSLFYRNKVISPGKAYMPGRGLMGFLPEVEIDLPDGQEGRNLETFMTQVLQVQENLPSPASQEWNDWIQALPDIAAIEPDKENVKRAARAMYKSLFKLNEKPKDIPNDIKLPSICYGQDDHTCIEDEMLMFQTSGNLYWIDKHYLAERATRKALIQRYPIFLLELDEGRRAEEWFGIKPMSAIVNVKPLYGYQDIEITEKVQLRYKERYYALRAIDEQIRLPAPDELNVFIVESLKLSIIDQGCVVALPSVSSWREADTIWIDVKDTWRGIGLALNTNNRRRQSDTFENILRAEDWSEVLERLREHGISEAALCDIKQTSMEAINADITVNNSLLHLPLDKSTEKSINKPLESKRITCPIEHVNSNTFNTDLNKPVTPHEKSGLSSQKRGNITQSGKEKGIKAEKWIRKRLNDTLNDTWRITDKPERDNENRETDIVLRHTQFGEFHLEVKHMENEIVFWSQGEVKKAQDQEHPIRYLMVICCPNNPTDDHDNYEDYWIKDPLKDLLQFERSGVWDWQGSTRSQQNSFNKWEVPNVKPLKEANNFKFQINIEENMLKKISFNFETIIDMLQQPSRSSKYI